MCYNWLLHSLNLLLSIKMSVLKMVSLCILILLLTDVIPVRTNPTKYSRWADYKEAHGVQAGSGENKCKNGGPIRDLCESCSKITKNEVVFPLCCEDKRSVRSWCKNFLEYEFKQ